MWKLSERLAALMKLCSLLFWFVFLVGRSLCDVQILFPNENGQKYDLSSGLATLRVEWSITEEPPDEDEIESYTFTLVAASNNEIVSVYVFDVFQASELDENKVELQLANTVGTDGLYMLQVLAMSDAGYTIHYTHRFELVGMTGSRIAPSITDTVPPPPERNILDNVLPGDIDTRSFTVPYSLQTGRAKFAPMQLQPPTKVTKTVWTSIHETSAVSYFTAFRPYRKQLTTVTPGWSYVLPSGVNNARAAPMPSDNGGWHDARRRLSLTPRKTST